MFSTNGCAQREFVVQLSWATHMLLPISERRSQIVVSPPLVRTLVWVSRIIQLSNSIRSRININYFAAQSNSISVNWPLAFISIRRDAQANRGNLIRSSISPFANVFEVTEVYGDFSLVKWNKAKVSGWCLEWVNLRRRRILRCNSISDCEWSVYMVCFNLKDKIKLKCGNFCQCRVNSPYILASSSKIWIQLQLVTSTPTFAY